MKRVLAVALAIGVLAGALVAPAQAAKKKKKKKPVPIELQFFLHWDDDGAGGCDGMQHMNLEDTEGDTGCSYVFQPAQELFIATGASEPLSYAWPASDGVPFVLDASKAVTGEFHMRGNAAFNASVDWTLSGMSGGSSVEIAAGSTDTYNGAASGTTGPTLLTIEADVDKKLHKKKFTSLQLTTTVRGVASAYVGLENPGSFIVVPALK